MSRGYPKDWNSRRRDVYRRDGYKCQNCGAKGGSRGSTELHAHHIVPKAQGGSHAKSNLKTLCKACHDAAHGRGQAPTRKKKRGFLKRLFGVGSDDSVEESKPTRKEEFDDEDKDDDGWVRLGKSGSKGYFQKKVDQKQNARYGGCPACSESGLTVSWIGLRPGEKVKITECEECAAMFDERETNGEAQLHPIESPEELDSTGSAVRDELSG